MNDLQSLLYRKETEICTVKIKFFRGEEVEVAILNLTRLYKHFRLKE